MTPTPIPDDEWQTVLMASRLSACSRIVAAADGLSCSTRGSLGGVQLWVTADDWPEDVVVGQVSFSPAEPLGVVLLALGEARVLLAPHPDVITATRQLVATMTADVIDPDPTIWLDSSALH